MPTRRDGGPTRRALLLGLGAGVAAGVGTLSGCGIRLEDDAPRIPIIPTRTPVPLEDDLVALTRECLQLATAAAALPGALAAELALVHRRQHTVLRTTLLRGQVPQESLDATPTGRPSGSGTPSPTGSTSPTPTTSASTAPAVAALASAEATSAAGAATFADAADDLLAPLAALHAQRYAAGALLGSTPTLAEDPVGGAAVAAMVPDTQGAVYFLQVVAARTSGADRTRAQRTISVLTTVLAEQQQSAGKVPATLGHPLPFPVADAADAARLARVALATLRSAYGQHLHDLVRSQAGAGALAATRWLGPVEVEAHRWGLPLAPFPGLT